MNVSFQEKVTLSFFVEFVWVRLILDTNITFSHTFPKEMQK